MDEYETYFVFEIINFELGRNLLIFELRKYYKYSDWLEQSGIEIIVFNGSLL